MSILLGGFGDKAEESGSGVLAGAVVVLLGIVGLLISDIFLDLDTVEEPVLGSNLRGLSGSLDDLGPGEHGVNVVLELSEFLTAFSCVREVPDDLTGILETLDNFATLNVADEFLGISDDLAAVSHAALKFNAVIIASEAKDETGSEVRDRCDGRKGD